MRSNNQSNMPYLQIRQASYYNRIFKVVHIYNSVWRALQNILSSLLYLKSKRKNQFSLYEFQLLSSPNTAAAKFLYVCVSQWQQLYTAIKHVVLYGNNNNDSRIKGTALAMTKKTKQHDAWHKKHKQPCTNAENSIGWPYLKTVYRSLILLTGS